MLDAIRAEAIKMRRHRGTWGMVWIYPILIGILLAGGIIYRAVAGTGEDTVATAAEWIKGTAIFWHGPGSAPGRILVAAFTALVFAGEYNWNTWKLIVPVRQRWQLIVAKWLVITGFVFIALLLTNLLVLAEELIGTLQGSAIPDGVTLSAIVQENARAAAYSFIPIIFAMSFAALIAILTRSVLATIVLSIGLVILEGMLPLLGIFAYQRAPGLTQFLIEATPLFHIDNLTNWAFYRTGAEMALSPEFTLSPAWGTSLAIVLAWSIAAGALAMAWFLRQDMN